MAEDDRSEVEQQDQTVPRLMIQAECGVPPCTKHSRCSWYTQQMNEVLVGRYIARRKPFAGQLIAATLEVNDLKFEDYLSAVRKRYKGAAIRQSQKARRFGLGCNQFQPTEYIADIVEINHSKAERCGRPMTAPYQRGLEEMNDEAETAIEFQPVVCSRHYDRWWGVFAPTGHTQANPDRSNPRLLAYVRLRRNGNYALYAQILGHGDFLRYGIMDMLHFEIVRWLADQSTEETKGLEHLIYGAYASGGRGLQLWKRKMRFHPGYLVLDM